MVKVLCYTGLGYDTIWRLPAVASNIVEGYFPHGAPHTPIRFN